MACCALIFAGPASGQEVPGFFDGFWGHADHPDCIHENGQFSTCPAISIFSGVYSGQESSCTMTFHSDVPAFEAMLIYDLACSGEGESWTTRKLFMIDLQGRLNIVDDQGAWIYLPDITAVGAGTGTVIGD
ncbi:MAG: hypothetical protein Kow0013_29690 [Pararhodobacter sp.]